MNKILATAVGLTMLSALPVYADDVDVLCSNLAEMVASVAGAHQKGVSLKTLLQKMEALDGPAKNILPMVRPVILSIYETPRYETEKAQTSAIGELRNTAHVQCLQAHGQAS